MKRLAGLLFGLLLVLPQCGYHLRGRGNAIPPAIHSIAIPAFKNQTMRFQAEKFVTTAVKEEFISRSRLQLIDDPEKADALLEGEITGFNVRPLSYTEQASANLQEIQIVLNVRLIDRQQSTILFEGKNIMYVDSYQTETGDFFSQETESLQKIAERFAASIVSTILENF